MKNEKNLSEISIPEELDSVIINAVREGYNMKKRK